MHNWLNLAAKILQKNESRVYFYLLKNESRVYFFLSKNESVARYNGIPPWCIPTLVFMKPVDGFSSFLDILLFMHRSNCAKKAVLYYFFVRFSVYASMRVFIKRVDELCSLSEKFLLIHHTVWRYVAASTSLLGVALVNNELMHTLINLELRNRR